MLPIVGLNWSAIFVAAVVALIIGGFWYSPALFGNAWMKSMGWKKEDIAKSMKKMNAMVMASMYLKMFVTSAITAFVLSILIHIFSVTSLTDASELALLVWLGFVAAYRVGDVVFEGKNFNYYMINTMQVFVSLLVMSWIISAWF
ncbi:MAG: DUF1761 domain-containing protein [Candidatus Micrarchaeales archaeon]